VLFSRRMLVVLVVVALINTSWQLLRAWLPKFLQEGRGYGESEVLYFTSVFYVATDIGVLGAGALTLWMHRRGITVFNARCIGFLCCAIMAALALFVMVLPKGFLLLAVLLVRHLSRVHTGLDAYSSRDGNRRCGRSGLVAVTDAQILWPPGGPHRFV
jgi:ACS family hexuronate transporter-like MFS transporter